jgi:putative PIG3 family NAD(P)H quinone oxidoreductase
MRVLDIADGQLVMREMPVPAPAEGEVLIRVSYIGINRADQLQMLGKYAPPDGASPIPGLEVSGEIMLINGRDSRFAVGDKICALLPGGGYGEYVSAPESQLLPLPAGIGLKEAASLPEAAATSMMALHQLGNLRPGERVLMHGGASGLGILMTQIARAMGATVYATVGSDEKAKLLQQFNVLPINHRVCSFAETLMEMTDGQGVNLIIDTLGGPMVETHLRLLAPRGRLVTLAMLDGSALPEGMKMTRILMNNLSWHGATLRSRSLSEKAEIMRLVEQSVWPKLADGSIRPVIDRIFPFADGQKALQRMEERLHLGKILLEVPGSS